MIGALRILAGRRCRDPAADESVDDEGDWCYLAEKNGLDRTGNSLKLNT
jgi:hypothetical protein